MVAPSLYLLKDADALVEFVAAGGRLLATAFTDVVDEHDRFRPGGFTTRLGPALGVQVVEFAGVLPSDGRAFRWDGGSYAADVLAEELRLAGAEVLASFTPDGGPALTRHAHGAGEAYYLATLTDRVGRLALARHLVRRAGVDPVLPDLPRGVEAAARGTVITVINHNPAPVTLPDGRILPGYAYEHRRI